MDDELTLGRNLVRQRSIEQCLDGIVKRAAECDGFRSPDYAIDFLGHVSETVQEAMLEQSLAGLKLGTLGLIEVICNWTDDPDFQREMEEAGHDVTRDGLKARFEAVAQEWEELDQPEFMYAARAHAALRRLRAPSNVATLSMRDLAEVAIVFVDRPTRVL